MLNFAITGVAGYIAPRHLKAIKDTGNKLLAADDPHDSVGILDQYFPEVSFFTEFERFDRHLEKLRRSSPENKINYLSICSPNNLHDAHIRLALRLEANAICEKPLVLNPWNLDTLEELESEKHNAKVYTVLQLRVHPSILKLKNTLNMNKRYKVMLTYITARGTWYDYSWKGVSEKSGGIATNIGIHFFDILIWLFGRVESSAIHISTPRKTGGILELKNADVQWFLSTDESDLPPNVIKNGKRTFRSITIEDEEVEFTEGFTDLHTQLYKKTIGGKGFGIADARPSVELVYEIRNAKVSNKIDFPHPKVLELLGKR
jgi:UDP-N-acetyl-2-amino-2-deoxyglucuronate dehydrogenase